MIASRLLPLGRVAGHRGRDGELTVRIFRGDAQPWSGLQRVWVGAEKESETLFEVEAARAYRDRLVLKLRGVNDPTAAESLRGSRVAVSVEDAPQPPPGKFYAALLVGLDVVDDRGRDLGRVIDVMPTGGTDVLVIEAESSDSMPNAEEHEILVPLTEEMVEVDQAAGRIRITPPEGLLELNRS